MIEQEINSLRREIASLERQIKELDAKLTPATRLSEMFKDKIVATHKGKRFDPAGAEERRPLWGRLNDIAQKYGPLKTERAELRSRLKAYEKKVDGLINELKRKKKRASEAQEKML